MPFYSVIGRPLIDLEMLIRMLLVGYCFGIRSERRLCEGGPSESGLSQVLPVGPGRLCARHRRSRDGNLLRELFEKARTMIERVREHHSYAFEPGSTHCAFSQKSTKTVSPGWRALR